METSEVGRRNWRQLAVFLLRTLSVTRCPLHIVPNLTSQDTSNIVNEMAGGARIQYAFIIKDKDKDNVHIIHHAYQENLINIYFMLVCFFSLYLLIIWNIYLRELSPSSSLFRNFFQSWNSNFEGVILLPLRNSFSWITKQQVYYQLVLKAPSENMILIRFSHFSPNCTTHLILKSRRWWTWLISKSA